MAKVTFTPTNPNLTGAAADAECASVRALRKKELRLEAESRIAALFGTPPRDFALVWKEINMMVSTLTLMRKEYKGTATPQEIAAIDANESMFTNDIVAIRTAENNASASLDAAGTDTSMTLAQRLAEIEAVTPAWPA